MRYVFTHIPKTAGTSLFEAIVSKVGAEQVRRDYSIPLSDPPLKRNLKCLAASLRYQEFPERIVYGHFLTGKYARFNGRHFVPRADHVYITFLREPLERAISHYHFWRRIDATGNKAWEKMIREQWPLERFLLSRYYANLQSQFLSRFPLESFDFVGVSEHFERSLALLGERFPLFGGLPVLRSNVKPSEGASNAVSPELRARFRALNWRDYRLYETAVSWLDVAGARRAA